MLRDIIKMQTKLYFLYLRWIQMSIEWRTLDFKWLAVKRPNLLYCIIKYQWIKHYFTSQKNNRSGHEKVFTRLIETFQVLQVMNTTVTTQCFFLATNLEKTSGTSIANILTSILNSIFSSITCVGNYIVLRAIFKAADLHSPSFVLLSCLAIADLFVGLIGQPFFVAYKVAEHMENFGAYCTLRMFQSISSWITSGVSLLTLAAVSVDRLLALTLHLRYNSVVTVPRVLKTVLALWILSITIVMLRFWVSTGWLFLPVVLLLLTFLITTLCTSKIFRIVQRHQRQIHDHVLVNRVPTNLRNVLKFKRLAVTVLYVYGLFLIFYAPFCLTMIVETFTGYTLSVKIAYDYVATAVFINSALNPLVYCWRIREIQRAVKNVLRKEPRVSGSFYHSGSNK